MKNIFIPTDFSPNSENAVIYALELNKGFNAKITLFHSYFLPVYATDVPLFITNNEELKESSTANLEMVKNMITEKYSDNKFVVDLVVSEGMPNDEISDILQKGDYDLVVMGTKGATGLKEIFIGSITASVIENINCPVIAVPFESKFKGINKIVYASDYAENDFENIKKVVDFAKHFKAEVVVLHISTGKFSIKDQQDSFEQFSNRLKNECNYDKLIFKFFENKDLEGAVNKYIDEINADLIAMTNHHRNYFQKLFQRSFTKKMVNHTHIPLMVFHVAERGNYFL